MFSVLYDTNCLSAKKKKKNMSRRIYTREPLNGDYTAEL